MQELEEKTLAWTLQIKKFGNLIGGIAALSFLLMVLGATVRATDSGLACPDWPLCYDQLVPTFDFHIFWEWLHRALAGTVTVLVLIALFILKRQKILRFEFGRPLAFALLLLIIQIVLGAFTIFKLLDPKVVSLHLINALFFFSVLVWIHHIAQVKTGKKETPLSVPNYLRPMLVTLCLGVLSQIFLGGMVSTSHAGLACPDFPKCHGSWLPSMSYGVALQVCHRFVGFGLLTLTIVLSLVSLRTSSLPRSIASNLRILPLLVMVQICLGAINVFMQLPKWASVGHLTMALAIYSVAFKMLLQVSYVAKAPLSAPDQMHLAAQKVAPT